MGRTTPRNNLCPAAMCEHDCSRCTYTLKPPAPLMGYGGPLSDIDKIHPPQFQAPLPEEVYDLRHGCAVPVEPDDPRDERIAELEAQVTSQARRLAEVEVERDKLRECHCAELGVCYQHCDEAQGAVFRAEAAEARVRELEAENGRFADMLESSVADWRKLYAEERAERVRIEGILLNDVQDERQESDEHIKGLVTVIKTQDKNIGDLKAHIQRIGVDHDDVEARAEAAEAKLRRIEEWARDNCGTCGTDTGSYACMECRCGYDLEDYPQAATYQNNWTPPKEWGE